MYRLRWRLDYKNKPSKYGVWNEKSPHSSDKIWHQDKKDLIQITVEAECPRTRQIKQLVTLGAWDFVTMTVEAYARIRGFGQQNAAFAGLSLVSSKWKVTCWTNGKVSRRFTKPEESFLNISNI